jgi:hypothetical protein
VETLIKILLAVAWPLAVIVVAIVALIIVLRVTATRGEVSAKWKDWGFGVKAPHEFPSKTETAIAPPQEAAPEGPDGPPEAPSQGTDNEVSKPTLSFWSAKTEAELEAAFQEYKTSDSYSNDPELWETLRLNRRREIGVGDELSELNTLAEQNPTWVWPVIFKVRRHVRLQEFEEAEQVLGAALARSNSDNRKWVLREGVRLYFSTLGTERALEFIRNSISGGATDIEISWMFKGLSDQTKSEEEVFSYAVLAEISLTFDKSEKDVLFNLAYNYAKISEYRLTAFQRYDPLENEEDWPSAPNNMGIIASAASEAAQNFLFEKALEFGSDVAAANLARSLAQNGFIKRAESLLEVAMERPSAGDSVHLADAKAKVTKAKEDATKELDKFRDYAHKQDQRFTAAIRAAYLHFKNSSTSYPKGRFVSEDGSLVVVADADVAETSFKVGSTSYAGQLPRRPLCYEGTVNSPGASVLSSGKRLLIVQIASDTLRALIPPESLDKLDEWRVIDLSLASEPPPPPETEIQPS